MADAITELLEKRDLAAVRRALSKLAMAAAQAEDEEACDLSTAARDSGALPVICNLVGDPDPRCHNAALAVLVSFTMTEVDPDAHLNRALISDCGGFAYILERLFSESPLTIGLACGALQNLCRTSVGHVASLAQRGGTERLRALTSCGDDHVAVAANACLHNLLGWHEAASRLQIRYLRHSRKVHVHEASGHNVAVGSSANRGTAAQSLIRLNVTVTAAAASAPAAETASEPNREVAAQAMDEQRQAEYAARKAAMEAAVEEARGAAAAAEAATAEAEAEALQAVAQEAARAKEAEQSAAREREEMSAALQAAMAARVSALCPARAKPCGQARQQPAHPPTEHEHMRARRHWPCSAALLLAGRTGDGR